MKCCFGIFFYLVLIIKEQNVVKYSLHLVCCSVMFSLEGVPVVFDEMFDSWREFTSSQIEHRLTNAHLIA